MKSFFKDLLNIFELEPISEEVKASLSAPTEMPPHAATLVWQQWKYRHTFFWKSVYIVTLTNAVVSTLPLFKNDIMTRIKWASLAFPVFGLLIGYFGICVLAAEYKRIAVVGSEYNTVPWSHGTGKKGPFRIPVGKPIHKLLRWPLLTAFLGIPAITLIVTGALFLFPPATQKTDILSLQRRAGQNCEFHSQLDEGSAHKGVKCQQKRSKQHIDRFRQSNRFTR